MIRTGTLIPGSETPAGDGVTEPNKALILVQGKTYAAIVKPIPPEAIAAECFAALLLRGWALPVPEPIYIDGNPPMFASMEIEYPSLKQKLHWRNDWPDDTRNRMVRVAAEIIGSFKQTPVLIAADEAIGNGDRNIGNILWDGAEPTFIDHERAFGLKPMEENKVATLAAICSSSATLHKSAVAAALTLSDEMVKQLTLPHPIDYSRLADFVCARIPTLANRVLSRFPQPNDLFNQVQ